MRVAFLGTPEPAVPALEVLVAAEDVDVELVVTNPDRPKGRSRIPAAPPVKEAALRHGLAVRQPDKPGELVDELTALDLDAAAVVAYGAILPREVLDTVRWGFVNLHFSLLPRWRGAAPVQHALRAGDRVTGVTTFVLDEGMDTGPVLRTREVPIDEHATAGDLVAALAELGGPLLVESLRALVAGEEPTPQPETGATLAPKLRPEDVVIDWSRDATDVVNLVRSAHPSPGAHTTLRDRRLKVWAARRAAADGAGGPGTVVEAADDGPVVRCGSGAVALTAVQPEGKASMSGGAFVNGYQPVGERLGA